VLTVWHLSACLSPSPSPTGSEHHSAKSRILDVKYNSSNNELVRTKTLVKGCVVEIEAAPFKTWYQQKYGFTFGTKNGKDIIPGEAAKRSNHLQRKIDGRKNEQVLDATRK
jgi:small subunit ribosomal protein S8e